VGGVGEVATLCVMLDEKWWCSGWEEVFKKSIKASCVNDLNSTLQIFYSMQICAEEKTFNVKELYF